MADALGLACRELVDMTGTCPYDQHHLDCEHWEADCEERCRGYDVEALMAECWRRYFEEKEERHGGRD